MSDIRVRELNEGPFRAAVLSVLGTIPFGRVCTFEDIALSMGYPRAASRLVKFVLSDAPADLPWYRVLSSDGSLPTDQGSHPLAQAELLAGEGVEVSREGRVDLDSYGFRPEQSRFRGPVVSQR